MAQKGGIFSAYNIFLFPSPSLPVPRLLEVAGVGCGQEDAVGGGAPLLGDPRGPESRQVGRAGDAVDAQGGHGQRGGPVEEGEEGKSLV